MVVAGVVWFGLPNNPSRAYFLSQHQKDLMDQRAIERAAYMGSEEFSWYEVKIALRDPKVYIRFAAISMLRVLVHELTIE